MFIPLSEHVFGWHAEHDLPDGFVVELAALGLLRDRVYIAQPALERLILEHRG